MENEQCQSNEKKMDSHFRCRQYTEKSGSQSSIFFFWAKMIAESIEQNVPPIFLN